MNVVTKSDIKELVKKELASAEDVWGIRFNSGHEAESVLREELHEARIEFKRAMGNAKEFANCLAFGDINEDFRHEATKAAYKAIAELVQVLAMIEKSSRGFTSYFEGASAPPAERGAFVRYEVETGQYAVRHNFDLRCSCGALFTIKSSEDAHAFLKQHKYCSHCGGRFFWQD